MPDATGGRGHGTLKTIISLILFSDIMKDGNQSVRLKMFYSCISCMHQQNLSRLSLIKFLVH